MLVVHEMKLDKVKFTQIQENYIHLEKFQRCGSSYVHGSLAGWTCLYDIHPLKTIFTNSMSTSQHGRILMLYLDIAFWTP